MEFRLTRAFTISVFAAGLLATLSIFVLNFYTMKAYKKLVEHQTHSEQTIKALDNLVKTLVDLESGQRGYALTHKETFLEPYHKALEDLPGRYERLLKTASDEFKNHASFQKLPALIERKRSFSVSVVDMLQAGQLQKAHDAVKNAQGKVFMDDIRREVDILSELEEDRLTDFKDQTSKRASQNQGWLMLGSGLTFVLIILAFLLTDMEFNRRSKVEEELVSAKDKAIEGSRLKSNFLANMSHEIRTPMNGILGMTEVLLAQELNKDIKSKVDIIRDSAISLLSLINGILDFSKIESGKLELEEAYFDIRKMVQEVRDSLEYSAKARGLEIVTHVSPQTPQAFSGDSLRIRQIVINLLGNAIKFSSEGKISLDVNSFRAEGSRTMVQIKIKDRGMGMSPEVLARIFSPFQQGDNSTTRKFGGTGLGLSITKELIELMKGTIEVESKPGEGSTFWVTLPLEPINALPTLESDKATEFISSIAPLKILVAEDNLTNQEVMKVMLQKLQHEYKMVANGKLAVEAAAADNYDLILMDCHMPEMDGYKAARNITLAKDHWWNSTPIVAVTANAVKGDKEECLVAGMCDYLSKPLTLAELDEKISLWSRKIDFCDPQVVDPKAMERLRQISENQAENMMRQIIGQWNIEAPQALQDLEIIVQNNNFDEIAIKVHHLKSTCNNAGLRRMAMICSKMEDDARSQNATEMPYLFLQMRAEYKLAHLHLNRARWI